MQLQGKRVDLLQLQAELTAAGIAHRALGVTGDNLHTYTQDGTPAPLPPGAQAVVDAHVPPPIPAVPNFGADLPADYVQQLANAVSLLRQYLALASPTAAQTATATKLLTRIVFLLLKQSGLGTLVP